MTWELFGDLALMFMILGSGVLIIYTNVVYNPNEDNDDDGV